MAVSGQRLRILQLLATHGELTGADMLKQDKSLGRGTIYTTLYRLQKEKLVTSRYLVQKAEPGPPRRFFKITALGERTKRAAEMAQAVMAGARRVFP